MRAGDVRERVFHPEDVERLREEREKDLAGAIPFQNEQRMLGQDAAAFRSLRSSTQEGQYQNLEKFMASFDYGVVIIGSGFGGSVAALRYCGEGLPGQCHGGWQALGRRRHSEVPGELRSGAKESDIIPESKPAICKETEMEPTTDRKRVDETRQRRCSR